MVVLMRACERGKPGEVLKVSTREGVALIASGNARPATVLDGMKRGVLNASTVEKKTVG